MILRYLLNAWIRQAAQDRIQSAVSGLAQSHLTAPTDAMREPGADAGELPPCAAVFVFALNMESGGFIDRLTDVARRRFKTRDEYDGYLQGRRVVVIDSGIGMQAAAHAAERAIARHRPGWMVSAGFAGALQEHVRRGHVVLADTVANLAGEELGVGLTMDPQSAAATRGLHLGRLLTVDRIVGTAEEKRELGVAHGALACDMETWSIAEVCRREATRFLSVRVISDALDDELPPDIEALVGQKTTAAKLGAAAGALFHRPSSVKDMWRMKEEAIKASDRVAKFLEGVFAQLP